jgi:hypothetical protein
MQILHAALKSQGVSNNNSARMSADTQIRTEVQLMLAWAWKGALSLVINFFGDLICF